LASKSRRYAPKTHGELAAEDLRWRCDPDWFDFETTAELGECPIVIIGQTRAVEALRVGLAIRDKGYNVFAAGEVGSGRSSAVKRELADLERGEKPPDDYCFVYNFADPDQPRLLSFPVGKGRAFQKGMDRAVDGLARSLPDLLESELARKRRSARIEAAKEKQKNLLKEFEKKVEQEGFAVVQVQVGPFIRPSLVPVVAGNPADMDQLESLVEEGKFQRKEYDRLRAKQGQLTEGLDSLTREFHRQERDLRNDLAKLDRDLARPVIVDAMDDLREEFAGAELRSYLEAVQDDMLDHLDRFREADPPGATGAERDKLRKEKRERMLPYAVNVVVDNTGTRGRPILWETSPSYRNLFGTVERARDAAGEWQTDHTRIKAGSLLKAHGGFLVLDALDVLVEPGVWSALKRTLRNGILEIQSFDPFSLYAGGLKPERVPIEVKVILIGTRQIYRLLHALDEDFTKIFKVKAEFTTVTPLNDEELQNYACFVHKKVTDEKLQPFHREAVAAVVEHGVRLAGRKEKLTTRFNEIADLVRESAYRARGQRGKRVEAKHVREALEQRARRVNLVEELLRERIAEGTVLLNLDGETVGQVNGLMVVDVGDHQFGLPARITAVTGMGRAGIVNIEREARMSGSMHTKGVLILSGFLRDRFAQDKPLTLSASLAFEQSYDEIDGDSASSTELYALLSSLSGIPIRQAIAVTGSVNQKGEIQPIGGINEKIEGVYDLARHWKKGTGYGVMIPARNVPHLMLRTDVVEAVRSRDFRIWAVHTIEEGIEILTGVPAGARGKSGAFDPTSVFGRVDARLRDLALGLREFGLAEPGGGS